MIVPKGKTWHADFYLERGPYPRPRIRQSLETTDRREAQRKARELKAKLEAEAEAVQQAPPSGLTLNAAWLRAGREYEPWRSSKSPDTILSSWRHVAGFFGPACPLASVNSAEVQRYAESMRAAGLSGSTVNQRLSFLSTLFKQAEQWGEEVVKPRITRQRVRPGRKRIITYEEEAGIVKLLGQGVKPKHRDAADLVQVMVDSGLRLSEALRLRLPATATPGDRLKGFTEIDLLNRMMLVWEAKADNPAAVPMTDRVYNILLRRGGRPFPLTVDQAETCWQWVRRELHLEHDKEFVLHALRHTTPWRLLRGGADAFAVQRYMRHKNIQTTMLYVHLEGGDIRHLAGMLGSAQQHDRQRDQLSSQSGKRDGADPHQAGVSAGSARLLITGSAVRVRPGEPNTTRVPEENEDGEDGDLTDNLTSSLRKREG